jgi:paraquat-inducible protein B
MSFRDFILSFTPFANKNSAASKKTEEFLKQLKNEKEDLDHLQRQINSLRTGLNESPDTDQNGYFKGLLTKFESEESALNQKIARLNEMYQNKMQSLPPQQAMQASDLIERNQERFQEQTQRMHDLMESNQMRAQDQVERLNALMEQNQMLLEALIERTNTLMERTNSLMEQGQARQQNYLRRN